MEEVKHMNFKMNFVVEFEMNINDLKALILIGHFLASDFEH